MAKRRQEKSSSNFDSFNDILTCLAGVMVLIIILVVIDSKKNQVLIPTPIPRDSSEFDAVYVEVGPRGNVMLVNVRELEDMADRKLNDIQSEAGNNRDQMLQLLAANQDSVGNANYYVDLSAKLLGTLIIYPRTDAEERFVPTEVDANTETLIANDWYTEFIQTLDKDRQYITFIVRSTDTAFDAFKRARALAWLGGVRVAYEVFDNTEPLVFGLGGNRPRFQ